MERELTRKQIELFVLRITAYCIIFLYGAGILLALVTSFEGRRYYSAWAVDHGVFAFGTALQMFIAAEMAIVCYFLGMYIHSKVKTKTSIRPSLWIPVALAFMYAGMDEAIMLHEKLLAAVGEKSRWLYSSIFGTPDNLFVFGCAVCAVIFTFFLFKEFRHIPRAKRYYLAGLFLLILAGAMDFLPPNILERRLPQGFMDLAEYFAGTSFAVAFLITGADRMKTALVDWFMEIHRRNSRMLDILAQINASHEEDLITDK